ncbi:FadR/GntR family transcriptional regulator [Saccharomonospora piscinae]|uniref:GntR family transcriptional regulator n=1 Tax=Saccharomonospora piscinae TaxID=687388 RepID=A0A1V8ZWU7_SACPI|nr:FadR/GntR family transcriptional regulator [Saccharomonospora piscinae]OQO89261.1 GntR family transcriptional regulator [Saccharomonospora piscinae]TLW90946.1 FadR family transcriptional regulator [Saccharomonospora piscinae]
MPLASTRRTGLVDQVIDQLRDAVRRGEWALGERIPTEAELAATLGVGRNTVREAVRALAHGGLLEVRQGDGTYVRATSEVSGALRRLGESKLREALQVRRILEVEGARLAAAARTGADLDTLTRLLGERDALWSRGRVDDFARCDAEFHLAMVDAAHNSVLSELYRGLTELVTASVVTTSSADLHHAEPVDHRGIVAAIADGDADRAARHTTEFLDDLVARHLG